MSNISEAKEQLTEGDLNIAQKLTGICIKSQFSGCHLEQFKDVDWTP